MQKSQITFAPVSFYTLRKQKRPIDQQTNDEPPPVLTKGSETEFDNCEEPPPPLLEAETATNNDDRFATLNGSAQSDGVTSEARTSTTNVDRIKSADEAGDAGAPIEPFFLESRHLPSWIRHCPKCSASQNIEVLFRGRIAGVLHCRRWEWPLAIEDHRTESVGCNFSELKPSTSSTMAIGGDASPDETQTITAMGDVAFNENYLHQFGMSFPVMFEMQNGHASGHCERITFRGFVYCHISRQVRTRGGGDSISHWRCQQQLGSSCSGLVRLEGKNLMVVKGHKHLPDYATARAILSQKGHRPGRKEEERFDRRADDDGDGRVDQIHYIQKGIVDGES
uniref:FLYWCH-type domain-containing protein n=1 Tax=Globodera rostochiensis TaxID=31243 RepID=A0A914IHF3_GLORO